MEKIFRNLKADEIDLRVGDVREKGCSLLLYKNARVDMDILDETVGPMNWQREHREIKGVMYCGVSIWDQEKGVWVTKWDAGVESNTEEQKGEASDSFKRSCVNWSLGRELYTGPQIFHFCETVEYTDKNGRKKYNLKNKWETFGMKVSQIQYDENNAISFLQIVDKKGLVVYEHGQSDAEKKLDHPEFIDDVTAKTIITLAEKYGVKVAEICKAYKVDSVYSLTHEQAGKIKKRLMATKEVKK